MLDDLLDLSEQSDKLQVQPGARNSNYTFPYFVFGSLFFTNEYSSLTLKNFSAAVSVKYM